MNAYGHTVAHLLFIGLILTGLALLRGQFDGVGLLAAVFLLLALFTTVAAWTNRKRNRT